MLGKVRKALDMLYWIGLGLLEYSPQEKTVNVPTKKWSWSNMYDFYRVFCFKHLAFWLIQLLDPVAQFQIDQPFISHHFTKQSRFPNSIPFKQQDPTRSIQHHKNLKTHLTPSPQCQQQSHKLLA